MFRLPEVEPYLPFEVIIVPPMAFSNWTADREQVEQYSVPWLNSANLLIS
jgi:hypothetical protein